MNDAVKVRQVIGLEFADQREGLRIWRALQQAHDLMHVAENDWQRWLATMQQMYEIPDGFVMTDITRGFVAPEATAEARHD